MATANIVINQAGSYTNTTPGSRQDLIDGYMVTLSNQNDVGVFSRKWTLVDKPIGSSAILSSTIGVTTTFTPDVPGTYLVSLLVNGNIFDQKGAAVLSAHIGYRVPAAQETIEFNTIIVSGSPVALGQGWAYAHKDAFEKLDTFAGDANSKVNTIAALRASSAYLSNSVIEVTGYYSAGDGGGSYFHWDAASTAADDGGMVIKPTAVSGAGRWIRTLAVPGTISVNQYGVFPGAGTGYDLGIAINAADGYLLGSPGTILVPDGYYIINTQVHLTENHRLLIGVCDIATLTGNATPIVYDSNTEIAGVGWNSIIREPANDWFTTIQGYAMTINDSGDAESNVYLHDFQVQGPYATSFNSAPSAIACGNGHNIFYERIWFNYTKSIGLDIGGFSDEGYHASEIWVENCLFTHVASQNIGVTNARNFHIIANTFKNAGQPNGPGSSYLDCEMNGANDVLINFEICNNLFDAYGGANPGNGILVQSTQVPGAWPTHCGPGVISNNTFLGGETDDLAAEIASAIFLSQANEVNIVGNIMKRLDQNAISINGSTFCNCTGNIAISVAGGGINAIEIFTSTHCAVNSNYISFDNSAHAGGSSVALEESGASDYNHVENNIFQWGSAAQPVSLITLVGAHSTATNNSSNGYTSDYTSTLLPTTTINTSRALLLSDDIALVDTTSGSVTLTLPDATYGSFATQTGMTGRRIVIKRIDGYDSVILSPMGGQKIDNGGVLKITDGSMVWVQSDGTNWWSSLGTDRIGYYSIVDTCANQNWSGNSSGTLYAVVGNQAGNGAQTCASVFYTTRSVTCIGARFYWTNISSSSIHVSLWDWHSQARLTDGYVTTAGGIGAYEVTFASVVSLNPFQNYLVSFYDTAGGLGHYSYFTPGNWGPIAPLYNGEVLQWSSWAQWTGTDAFPATQAGTERYPVEPILRLP